MLLSIIRLFRAFSKKLKDDYISAFSAQAAFFLIISFFPFVMFLLTLINYLPISLPNIFATLERIFPKNIAPYLSSLLTELLEKSNGAVLSITAVAALWTASKGFFSIVRGLNSIYKEHTHRNYFVTRFWSTIYTLLFAMLLVLVMLIFVFGNQLTAWLTLHFPVLKEMALLIISARTLTGLGLMILFFTLMYVFVPDRKSNLFAELPGAILTSAGWLGFSYLYSYYIDHLGNYSATYGSLTAIVLCMIWIYACMYIMFLGAEVNQILANPNVRKAFHTWRDTRRQQKALRKSAAAEAVSEQNDKQQGV